MREKNQLAKAIDERVGVRCRNPNCGQVWYPNPKKWNNFNFVQKEGRHVKALHCPSCNTTNYIALKDVAKIIAKKLGMRKLGENNSVSSRRASKRVRR